VATARGRSTAPRGLVTASGDMGKTGARPATMARLTEVLVATVMEFYFLFIFYYFFLLSSYYVSNLRVAFKCALFKYGIKVFYWECITFIICITLIVYVKGLCTDKIVHFCYIVS